MNAREPLNTEQRRLYRTAVGKLLWMALVRPDLSCATKETKELSSDLISPTGESVLKLKGVL